MPRQLAGSCSPDVHRHRRAPITALGRVARVAEPQHQVRPGAGDALHVPSGAGRLIGESVARQRRGNHVERVGGIAPERGRIRQRLNDFMELNDRSRPAVRNHQRHRIGMRRLSVNEMNPQAVDRGPELRKPIELLLARTPVVLLEPVFTQLLRITERDALGPVVHAFRLGPACVAQPPLQVVELLVSCRNAKRFDVITHELPSFLPPTSACPQSATAATPMNNPLHRNHRKTISSALRNS